MHMAIVFYGIAGLGSLLFSYWYMQRYWTDEKLNRLNEAEQMSQADLDELRAANEYR